MKQIAHIDNCIVSEMSTWQMILLILKLINWHDSHEQKLGKNDKVNEHAQSDNNPPFWE